MHIARLQQRPVPMPHRRLQTPPIVKHLRMIRRKGMPQDVLTPCLKTRCRAQSAPPPVPIWRTDENRLPLCPLRIITPQPCQHGARQRHLPTAARLALPRANPHLPLLPIHIAPGQTPHLIRTNPAVKHHRHARRTGGKLLPLCRPQQAAHFLDTEGDDLPLRHARHIHQPHGIMRTPAFLPRHREHSRENRPRMTTLRG